MTDRLPARSGLPAEIVALLDGSDLEHKTAISIAVMTVDPDGWPRPAHLSAGEVLLAPGGEEVRLCLHAVSATTANVRRTGQLVLSLVSGGADHELRCAVSEGPPLQADLPLATFAGPVVMNREHRASYAEVTGGISFRLHDPASTLSRWKRQIDALRRI